MDAKQLVTALCIRWEGLYLKPYLCPAGVPTIGIGTTHYENGQRVTLKDPEITKDRAYELLNYHLDNVVFPALRRQIKVPMSTGLTAALADFTYNMGESRLASSTLRKRVNAGQLDDVPTQLRKWTYGGAVQLTGLVRRREDEIKCLAIK